MLLKIKDVLSFRVTAEEPELNIAGAGAVAEAMKQGPALLPSIIFYDAEL